MALAFACSLLSVFPALAGEWRQTEDKEWQYIQDDGTKATGWLEVDGNRYYLDEDGVMAKNTWIDNYYVDSTGRFEKKR